MEIDEEVHPVEVDYGVEYRATLDFKVRQYRAWLKVHENGKIETVKTKWFNKKESAETAIRMFFDQLKTISVDGVLTDIVPWHETGEEPPVV